MQESPEGLGSRPVEFWLQHVRLGLVMSATVIGMITVHLVLTPDHPHRRVLWLATAVAVVVTATVWRLPWRRLVASGVALWALQAWSLALVPLIVLLTHLDGGPSSPMAQVILLPVVFAAMAYPVRGILVVGVAAIAGQLVLAVTGGVPPGHAGLQVTVLCLVTVMGARIAHNHARTLRRSEELAARLGELARVDGLTGCLNHRGFHERLDAVMASAAACGGPVALLQVDVDHFKQVNDTHGHPAGDDVLAQIGEVLRACARRGDVVGRMGGEEFFVLLPDTDLETAHAVGQRLRRAVADAPLLVAVTVSVGVSAVSALTSGADELIDAADRALYAAKRAGRDRVVVAPAPDVRTAADHANDRA